MRRYLLIGLSLMIPLLAASSAQAIVVNDGGTYAGVALMPSTRGASLPSGVSAVTSSLPCTDPALTQDFWYLGQANRLPDNGLCYHGGSVIHKNETFALTWDNPQQVYWSGTKQYVEQFLKDVADDSGKLDTPFAVTAQYTDGSGRAQDASVFGGGCIDHGTVAGSACEWANQAEIGHNFPASGCTPTGSSFTWVTSVSPNTTCLTDAQLRQELSTMVGQTGMLGRTQAGFTPLVTLLLPPGVETCLDAAGRLCSTNASLTPPPPKVTTDSSGSIPAGSYRVEITYTTASGEDLPSAPVNVSTSGTGSSIKIDSPPSAPGATGWNAYVTQADGAIFTLQGAPNAIGSPLTLNSLSTGGATPPNTPFFCSYHSHVNVGGTDVAYIVEPWTGVTGCDEPDAPGFPQTPTPDQLSTGVGVRLVSSLSQAQISAIVNPDLTDGWFAVDGSEVDDNHGCTPLSQGLDSFDIGSGSYLVQREFNNGGVIQPDPNTYFGCAPNVILSPRFVVPSAVNPGDEVQFDGSITASTLLVPEANYHWNFGDGTSANGPAVVHAYSSGGSYTVTLTVTDRGSNTDAVSQTVTVLGGSGSTGGSGSPGSGSSSKSTLQVHILLMPQSRRSVLEHGVNLRVSSNAKANGIAWVSIPRSLAKRAHIKAGHKPFVVIGVGTVSGITDGTVSLHLKLSRSVAAKLRHLRHVTLSVRLSLVGPGGDRVAVDAAGRY
jgi:hypothetical protein